MEARPKLAPVRALVLYFVYLVVFALGGGLAAGLSALVFEAVAGRAYEDPTLYAVVFGVMGYVAVRLARQVME
ncbi:MAG TPA: hypothetical protein VD962_08025 [Rubricoccaceae bacterium]|nr:hypothetical protein [Rubricoccaceae bacterium]